MSSTNNAQISLLKAQKEEESYANLHCQHRGADISGTEVEDAAFGTLIKEHFKEKENYQQE